MAAPPISLTFVDPAGLAHRVRARAAGSLMEAAVANGVPGIPADCGGACACGTCHVLIDADWRAIVGPPNAMEAQLLDLFDARPESRLACQVRLRAALDGLRVTVAPER